MILIILISAIPRKIVRETNGKGGRIKKCGVEGNKGDCFLGYMKFLFGKGTVFSLALPEPLFAQGVID